MIAIAFLLVPYVVRLFQVATAAGSRNPDPAASAQYPPAARATPTAFALGRPRSVHLALSSLPSHSWQHIRDRPLSFRSPWQNGYVERLIGSIRRECTDHLIVFNAEHLRRILTRYATYYNKVRTHVSLGKDVPCARPIERFGDIVAYPIFGGLHHRYARI
jgi:transposase InsO family protein